MVSLQSVLEESWLFIFLASIAFVFSIVFRDLRERTKKVPSWRRISYNKQILRVTLTYHHFTRKGELLSTTSINICKSIRRDFLDYLVIAKGFSRKDLDSLLASKENLRTVFVDEELIDFIYNPEGWLDAQKAEPPLLVRIFRAIKEIYSEQERFNTSFYIGIATIIKQFRREMEGIR